MVVAGIGMTMVGIETAWTGIGLVVALIGALIALFGGSHDSEIQLFAKHCIWGNSYGEDGGDDDWQEGRFENWHESKPGGLDRQIKALFNILQSFSIQGMAWKVRIQLGMHDSKSKLQVKFENNYLGESHSVEVVVDLARNRTRVVDPRDPGRLDTGGASVVYGDDYVEMTWYFGGYHHNSIGQDDKPTNPIFNGLSTEDEIKGFLNYTRFMVNHFKGKVQDES